MNHPHPLHHLAAVQANHAGSLHNDGSRFGALAEQFARFFGTPKFLIGQSLLIVVWISYNVVVVASGSFDPYPFILLNLVFSTQAAYAAPLILLAQTRQAERDKTDALGQATLIQETDQIQKEQLEILRRLDTIICQTA